MALNSCCSCYLHLPGLIVEYCDTIRDFPSKLDKLLVRWVLVQIVVTVFGVLELDYEAVC
jgi:hypothetical protein